MSTRGTATGSTPRRRCTIRISELNGTCELEQARGAGRGRGRRGGRRGGRAGGGRAEYGQPSDAGSVLQVDADEDAVMKEVEESRKRSSDPLGEPILPSSVASVPNLVSLENMVNPLAIVPAGVVMVSPPPKREPKRTRKEDDGTDGQSTTVKTLGGSFEERRRAQ